MFALQVRNLSKSFGKLKAVDNVADYHPFPDGIYLGT